MFALIDRTQLTLFQDSISNNAAVGPGQNLTISLANGSTVQAGMLIEIGTPGNSEVVVAKTGGAGTFTADVLGNWAAGTQAICRGNPGPWTTPYNPRRDSQVVPYFTVIQ